MRTNIVGFRPPGPDWNKMKAIWDACEAADIPVPASVLHYFHHEKPDQSGVTIDLEDDPAVSEYSAEMEKGYEVDLSKLPDGIKIIRFYNSW